MWYKDWCECTTCMIFWRKTHEQNVSAYWNAMYEHRKSIYAKSNDSSPIIALIAAIAIIMLVCWFMIEYFNSL